MKDKIIKLIDLKSIITLALTATLIWGFIVKLIDAKEFLVYVTMVLTFYFAKKDTEGTKENSQIDKEVG